MSRSSFDPTAVMRALIADLTEVQDYLYPVAEEDAPERFGFPATEVELDTVEEELGYRLPSEYRQFLRITGGWWAMHECTHALNPGELLAGEFHQHAWQLLADLPAPVLREHGLRLEDLLPIAASDGGLDLMALVIRGERTGSVLWAIGYHSNLFPSVTAWLEALVEDSRSLATVADEL